MRNKIFIILLLIFLQCDIGDLLHIQDRAVELNTLPRQLEVIGTYENKTYYSENTHMTWDTASAFCIQNNMTLVRVESLQELFYIWSVLNFDNNRFYWTEGREYGSYLWSDSTEIPLGVASGSDSFNNCVMIYNSSGRLLRYPCNSNPDSRTTLPICQIVTIN